MRHGVKLNHLGRTSAHRKALLSRLACELITHKRIITTLAKAKALRVYVEPLVTKSKTNTTHQRRVVFSYLQDKEVVTELFSTVSTKIAERQGGYTRIIKLGTRLGDAAEMALIELVDFNEIYSKEAPGGKKRRTRRGRSGGKKTTDTPATIKNAVPEAETKAGVAEETPEEEATAQAGPDAEVTQDEKPDVTEAVSETEEPKAEEPVAEDTPEKSPEKEKSEEKKTKE